MISAKHLLLTISIATLPNLASSQLETKQTEHKHGAISFIENKGQWNNNVAFRAPLGTGSVYLEKNVFTYSQIDAEDLDVVHHHSEEEEKHQKNDFPVDGHAWKATFVGANTSPSIGGLDKLSAYHNYYIGDDPSKWASNVPLYEGILYADLYPNIDLHVYSQEINFKYDFIVAPNANPSAIQISYSGLDDIRLEAGNLICQTSVGEFIENAPFAFQLINGEQVEVECNYLLNNQTISFEFPNGYDPSIELIIDPVLVGATYSGTMGTNWGHCATYDYDENIYTGARSFDSGYPTTVGAFQVLYGGGHDIGISKLNPDASALIYATYIGGGSADLVQSLVVNQDNELYVLSSTYSADYPVSVDAFSSTFSLRDLAITHLTADGSAIIGSTYVGGSADDGSNLLTSNYGDENRGEIIVDDLGNCFVASSSASTDFPTTAGAHQETFGGGTLDAVVFSMSPDLSTLIWSTYIGGTGKEVALGLRLDGDHNIYVTGATDNEFMAMSGYQTNYQGGALDGFIVKLIADGTSIEYSSYWGTTSKDASFFTEVDLDNNVYLYGQSDGGTSLVTPGVYSNPSSQQFICKLSSNLEDVLFATVLGDVTANFTPIAFMVDYCNYIYFSGHTAGFGLPVTDDAILDASGAFYLGVLKPGATDLYYATYFTGTHVDGGTSRFDPANGTVYQGVCSCEGFMTTPGALADTKFGSCDVAVFKIDFEVSNVVASAEATPEAMGCSPLTIEFDNTSSGLLFEWDFGDGSPTTDEFEPTHIFTDAGIYNVQLIAYNPEGCLGADTTYIEIIVVDGIAPEATFDFDVNCATGEITITYTGTPDLPFVFEMGDGTSYFDTEFTHMYDENGTFIVTLTVGDGACADYTITSEEINIGAPPVNIISNNPSCFGFFDGSVTIDVLEPTTDEEIIITDQAGNILNVGGSNTANTLPSGWYYFSVDLGNGCSTTDSVFLEDPLAMDALYTVNGPPCYGEGTGLVVVDTVLNAQGDYNEIVYIWAPDPNGSSGKGGDSLMNVPTGNYTLTINDENGCSQIIDFTIVEPEPLLFSEFGFDPAYCRLYDYQNGNGVVYGAAIGGTPDYTYQWTNLETGETVANTTWGGRNPGTYELAVTDGNGCTLVQALILDSLNPIADFTVTIDQLKTDCDALVPVDITFTNLSQHFANPNNPFADTTFFWNFNHDNIPWIVSTDFNEAPVINYSQSGTYEICLVATNKNGCTDTNCVELILCDPTVFVPVNIFSPNGDGKNDVFSFVYKSIAIKEFYCVVVDRWGVTIAEFNSLTEGWNGKDKQGNYVPDGVYFYKYVGKEDTGAPVEGQGTIQVVK